MPPLSPMVSRFFLEITVQAFIDPYACVHSLTFFHLQSIKKRTKFYQTGQAFYFLFIRMTFHYTLKCKSTLVQVLYLLII
jgi:hypothetical protein